MEGSFQFYGPQFMPSPSSSCSLSTTSPSASDTDGLPCLTCDIHPILSRSNNHGDKRFILVIGGLGYIGSHTTLELLQGGFNVIVVDNLSNSTKSVLDRIKELVEQHYCNNITGPESPTLHFHQLDYRAPQMADLLDSYNMAPVSPQPQTLLLDNSERGESTTSSNVAVTSRIMSVIHFAGYKAVSESIARPLPYYVNNVYGLVDLLLMLRKHNVTRLVLSSSAAVYGTEFNAGADAGTPLSEDRLVHHPEVDGAAVTEPTPAVFTARLTSPYARTKYFSEAILADIATADPSWTITALRYFNPVGCHVSGLLGEDPQGQFTNLFPLIMQVLTGQRSHLDIFGSDWPTRDGTAMRDFVHVVDVAHGHIAALTGHSKAGFRAFNLGSGRGTTVLEVVTNMELVSGRKIPIKWADRRPGDVGVCVAATERAAGELKWRPTHSIKQCAADVWNFICKRQDASY